MGKDFFFASLLVVGMEDPLDVHVSEELIEVNAQEEVTSFAFDFERRNDDIVRIGLQHATTRVLLLYLDGRHVDYFVFIKRIERVLAVVKLENRNLAVT